MKAFLKSLIALAVITVVAAVGLGMVPMSSQDVFTHNESVRL